MGFRDVGDRNLNGNLCRRMSDRLDDDLHDQNLDVSRVNRNYVRHDLMTDVNLDGNLCRRMSDRLDDQNLDVNRVNRNCVRRDQKMDGTTDDRKMGVKMDVKMDGNLYRHTNVTDDRNDLTMVVSLDVSRGHRMSDRLDDQNLDVSRVNRRTGVHLNAQLVYEHRVDLTIDPECYVRHDLMTDVNLDAMSHRVMYY